MRKVLILALAFAVTTSIYGAEAETAPKDQSAGPAPVRWVTKVEDKFEIQGTVTSSNESSFMVRGELVAAPSEKMERWNNNHILDAGNLVLVTGNLKNNMMVATDVVFLGKNPEIEVKTIPETNIFKSLIEAIKDLF